MDLTGGPVRKYLPTDSNIVEIVRKAISQGQIVMAVPKK